MGLSKRKRFEVFKRDGFVCQYCGQAPPTVILEVDHIDPRANGGSDDTINLITACFDCNRGKSDRKLGDIHPRPDADMKYLKVQQEIAEARRYLETQAILDDLRDDLRMRLELVWAKYITEYFFPPPTQWSAWLHTYSPEEVEYGLMRAGIKYNKPHGGFGGSSYAWITQQIIKYASAVMRNERQDKAVA